MKLRNKETGEIGNLKPYGEDGRIWVWVDNLSSPEYRYDSLAELNAEWEDYEEPKEYWYIDWSPKIAAYYTKDFLSDYDARVKEIGNCFETKEEAERAVEKLKAWKRLKDKGFRFILDGETEMPMFVYSGANGEKCITSAEESKKCREDIKLLFGGEDE